MSRRKRFPRPSQFRFLEGARVSLIAFVLLMVAEYLIGIPCALAKLQTCPQLPSTAYYIAMIAIVGGVVASGYRYYRDFVLGEYWMDLSDAGYL